jgi:hypothetical protein
MDDMCPMARGDAVQGVVRLGGRIRALEIDALSAQLVIPVPIADVFESAGGTSGLLGALSGGSTPALEWESGTGPKANLVLSWAAANVDPIQFGVVLPPCVDLTEDIVLHYRAKVANVADAGKFTSRAWVNEGDTAIADAQAANLTAEFAEHTITIAGGSDLAGGQVLHMELTPPTHASHAITMSLPLWFEATRQLLTL